MIPSDHFVRFYNEVFKFLDRRDGLQKYYDKISSHQDFHCLKEFQERGLQGVHDYYVKIRREENCDLDIILNDGELILRMNVCPSLTKALDNDAGACPKYCLHCPGWVFGVYTRAGLYDVYDMMGLDEPKCTEYIYSDLERARAKYQELLKTSPAGRIMKNFD